MTMIADTATLADFCRRLGKADFVTVDTEFLRDRTYWPRLCLIQLADDEGAAAIDTLAPGLDLAPVRELLSNPGILKVFHAARQDVEIFYHLWDEVPFPLFDTQVAAMVCGFGDSVSYENLVSRLAKGRLDKSSRFTDWSRRPLSERQLRYALGDVTYLRDVYRRLKKMLDDSGRASWLDEEMAVLTAPATYTVDPQAVWRRLKPRSRDPLFLAIVRELAAWRESEAQDRNIPRNRVLRDEMILDIAAQAPADTAALGLSRGISRNQADGPQGQAILAAVARGKALPPDQQPTPPPKRDLPAAGRATLDLLKVVLKIKCDEAHVAPRLVADTADLEKIAMLKEDGANGEDQVNEEIDGEEIDGEEIDGEEGDELIPALHGWRREVFGSDALRLKRGELAIALHRGRLRLVPVSNGGAALDGLEIPRRKGKRRRGGGTPPPQEEPTPQDEG